MAIDVDKLKEFFTFKKRGEENKSKEPELMTASTGKYEVNLVPEVKYEMIRTQKVRNLVLFVAIIVVSISVGIVMILGSVKLGQDVALGGLDDKLKTLSRKITSDSELADVLTVQNQLNKISEIEDNKKVLSRVFGLLTTLLPTGEDKISISELNINLDSTTLSFDAQADAGVEPLIDYRVLEAFKKSVGKMKYDYGRYVTKSDMEIPTRCIKEADDNGEMYVDEQTGGIYAEWQRNEVECLPGGSSDLTKSELSKYEKTLKEKTTKNAGLSVDAQKDDEELEKEALTEVATELESVKIWRTPQFNDWYKSGNMELDGTISEIEHFNSQCITYTGAEGDKGINWSADNSCDLAPDGVTVSDSANGRDSSGALVLRFSASVQVAEGFFAYNNKHVMGIGPFGQNVTDSYLQTENIFEAPARECDYDDADCMANTENSTGE